jgi:UDP-N-acetylmuramoyl-L-alanyl-D-glutamate--2,6-diaminopimelate ligase
MGEIAAAKADLAIVTSDNPRTEDPERILDDIVAGMRGASYERIEDRRDAIKHALAAAEPDDVIVLAGKGHETYQIRGTTSYPFDEKAIVRELTASAAGLSASSTSSTSSTSNHGTGQP